MSAWDSIGDGLYTWKHANHEWGTAARAFVLAFLARPAPARRLSTLGEYLAAITRAVAEAPGARAGGAAFVARVGERRVAPAGPVTDDEVAPFRAFVAAMDAYWRDPDGVPRRPVTLDELAHLVAAHAPALWSSGWVHWDELDRTAALTIAWESPAGAAVVPALPWEPRPAPLAARPALAALRPELLADPALCDALAAACGADLDMVHELLEEELVSVDQLAAAARATEGDTRRLALRAAAIAFVELLGIADDPELVTGALLDADAASRVLLAAYAGRWHKPKWTRLVERLARDPDPRVRAAIPRGRTAWLVEHPALIDQYATAPDPITRAAYTDDELALRCFAVHPDPDVRVALIGNYHIPVEALVELAHQDAGIRSELARIPKLPAAVRAALGS